MKIYDQTKTQILENPDLEKGYLINDKILVQIIPAQEEKFHYEMKKQYPNGGCDMKKVIDIEGKKESRVYEDIKIYIPYTQIEQYQKEFASLKSWFEEKYAYKEQKYRRLITLGKCDDDGESASVKLSNLYNEAEQKRQRIQELESLI